MVVAVRLVNALDVPNNAWSVVSSVEKGDEALCVGVPEAEKAVPQFVPLETMRELRSPVRVPALALVGSGGGRPAAVVVVIVIVTVAAIVGRRPGGYRVVPEGEFVLDENG